VIYIDTSALAKWYLPELGSGEVEEFVRANSPLAISPLTTVEMHSLLARRCGRGDLDAEARGKVLATFEGDVVAGYLQLVPHTVEAFMAARNLVGSHPELCLTTHVAVHLGTVVAAGFTSIATADTSMARAADKTGIECRLFARGRSD
jgi:uncharacterized protein